MRAGSQDNDRPGFVRLGDTFRCLSLGRVDPRYALGFAQPNRFPLSSQRKAGIHPCHVGVDGPDGIDVPE
jgi:hypothetical protein